MGAFPQAVGSGLPILCVAVTFGAQIVDLFHSGDIAGMGAGLVDDLPQLLGILQHGAGPPAGSFPGCWSRSSE